MVARNNVKTIHENELYEKELRSLCDRLLARANSVLLRDQPELQSDLRQAAQWIMKRLRSDA